MDIIVVLAKYFGPIILRHSLLDTQRPFSANDTYACMLHAFVIV